MTELSGRRRLLVLLTVCTAAFAINLDTTIVNVALPDLGRQLHATTRDLQWVVDGYNLAFAALVLTAGSLGDRFGRRPALLLGLAGAPLVGRAGLFVATAAIVGCVAATAPRVVRAAIRERRLDLGTFLQAFAVAGAYDIGRALAVVSRAPHRTVRAPRIAAAS